MSDLQKRKLSKTFMMHQNSASAPEFFSADRTIRPVNFKPPPRNRVQVLPPDRVQQSTTASARYIYNKISAIKLHFSCCPTGRATEESAVTPATDERFNSSIRRAAPADAMKGERDNDTSV
jgi:hypothetical protein